MAIPGSVRTGYPWLCTDRLSLARYGQAIPGEVWTGYPWRGRDGLSLALYERAIPGAVRTDERGCFTWPAEIPGVGSPACGFRCTCAALGADGRSACAGRARWWLTCPASPVVLSRPHLPTISKATPPSRSSDPSRLPTTRHRCRATFCPRDNWLFVEVCALVAVFDNDAGTRSEQKRCPAIT